MKHLKLLLKSLISNNACVEAARTQEVKYHIFGPLFLALALFFAALPTCVTGFQQQGSAWLNAGLTYSAETAFYDFGHVAIGEAEGYTKNGLELTINDHKLFVNNVWKENSRYNNNEYIDLDNDNNPITIGKEGYRGTIDYSFYRYPANEELNEKEIFEIYIFPEADNKELQLKVSNLLLNIKPNTEDTKEARENIDNSIKIKHVVEAEGQAPVTKRVQRSTSFIAFGQTSFYGYLYQPGVINVSNSVNSPISSVYGDYHHINNTENLIKDLTGDLDSDTLTKWKDFSNKGFIDTRFANTWKQTGIIVGVDAGVVLFMGLMVFLLTRGRNNPFRIYSIWDSVKIAMYASLTPGILALLGFLLKNMAMMLFILGVGVRVMWLSMKTLNYRAPQQK